MNAARPAHAPPAKCRRSTLAPTWWGPMQRRQPCPGLWRSLLQLAPWWTTCGTRCFGLGLQGDTCGAGEVGVAALICRVAILPLREPLRPGSCSMPTALSHHLSQSESASPNTQHNLWQVVNLDRGLTASQKAESAAFGALVEAKLQVCWQLVGLLDGWQAGNVAGSVGQRCFHFSCHFGCWDGEQPAPGLQAVCGPRSVPHECPLPSWLHRSRRWCTARGARARHMPGTRAPHTVLACPGRCPGLCRGGIARPCNSTLQGTQAARCGVARGGAGLEKRWRWQQLWRPAQTITAISYTCICLLRSQCASCAMRMLL